MNETIFDKITDIYHSLNSLKWHKTLGSEPEGFSSMNTTEKSSLCYENMLKLEYLLNHPADMLISWSWFDKHLHRTFDEWLQYQMKHLPVQTQRSKVDKIADRLKDWIRKVLK